MSLIIPTVSILLDQNDLQIITWSNAKFTDTFQPVARGDIVDRSIQVDGSFGVGTVVRMQGSNTASNPTDGTYYNLHDPFSNVIGFTSGGIAQIIEVTAWMKPAITAGTGSESITVTICARRSFR